MVNKDDAMSKTSSKLQAYLDGFAVRRSRPLLCIVGEINEQVADQLWMYYLTSLRGHKKLSVLLHSYGGDPKAAYRMILTLRADADEIEVLVPEEAKSAATLFCLGANDILIGYRGELGPLDTQIPDRNGEYHSALESFKASEQLLEHAVLVLKRTPATTVPRLLPTRRMSDLVRRTQAQQFMNSIVSNLYEDFDAAELGRNSRNMAEIEEYAIRAMRRGGYEVEEQLRNMARRLVWEYPSHDFLIDLKEAQEIGLKADLMDAEEELVYASILPLILDASGVDSIDELMDAGEDAFVGLGLLQAPGEQNDPDDAGGSEPKRADGDHEESED